MTSLCFLRLVSAVGTSLKEFKISYVQTLRHCRQYVSHTVHIHT